MTITSSAEGSLWGSEGYSEESKYDTHATGRIIGAPLPPTHKQCDQHSQVGDTFCPRRAHTHRTSMANDLFSCELTPLWAQVWFPFVPARSWEWRSPICYGPNHLRSDAWHSRYHLAPLLMWEKGALCWKTTPFWNWIALHSGKDQSRTSWSVWFTTWLKVQRFPLQANGALLSQ